MDSKRRIALVDWDIHVRSGRKVLIESNPTYQVVFEGKGSLPEISDLADALVDVLVVDQRLESISGIEFARRLKEQLGSASELPGLILTASYESAALRLDALGGGFDTLVSLEEGAEALLGAIGLVSEKGIEISIGSLFELINRVKPEPMVDLAFLTGVQALSKSDAKPIAQLQAAWKRLGRGGGTGFEIATLGELSRSLNLRTPGEFVIRAYRGGLLDVL